MTPLFTTAAMASREPEFRALVDGALDQLLPAGRLEWMADVAEPLPMVMVTRLLGVADEHAPALKAQGYSSVEAIGGFVTEERRPSLLTEMADFGPVLDAFLAARTDSTPDTSTVIGTCAKAVETGELSEGEVFAILGTLISAGGESTTSLLGTGARILAERPGLQQRLREEPSLIPTFVEEALRIDPPFRGHYRRITRDTILGGTKIPVGARVVLVWPAANRDPDAFELPEDIDLDRPNARQHVGFGWGIHLCIGAPLARIEARVAFERLLARTSSFTIEETDATLAYHKSLMIRRLVELPLVVELAT
jgi:cytochrome P450